MRLSWTNPKTDSTLLADHKVMRSKCGRYKLVRVHITYGAGPNGYPDYYYAVQIMPSGPDRIIGTARSERLARKICTEDAELRTLFENAKPQSMRRKGKR